MQIVIDIPKELYDYMKDEKYDEHLDKRFDFKIRYAVANAIPLPKGHGRLIDGDRFDVISYQHTGDDFDNGVMWLAEQIDNAPIIIEADNESEG